jgi:hypothetical protein
MEVILPEKVMKMGKKERGASKWDIIAIEGYCGLMWEYNEKSSEYFIDFDTGEKYPNPKYDPNAVMPEPPDYCIDEITYTCLEKGCKYFAYCEFKGEEPEEVSL